MSPTKIQGARAYNTSIERMNALLGTEFPSFDVMTDHQLLAALVALMAASLNVEIFICNPTTKDPDET